MPVAVSFTLETDGRLPSGAALAEAIERTDEATDGYPAYYMINCAHPSHFERVLDERAPKAARVSAACAPTPRGAAMPNSTRRTDLDAGDPDELGGEYRALQRRLPR